MVLSLTVILFLVLRLLPKVKSSMVTLNNNGYDGIVIAINPSVPEDEKLIQNIKAMVTEASTYLFNATKRRLYFRNVSILIPVTWESKSEYLMPNRETYDQADVIVANPYLKNKDDPYTLQYGQCGEKGQYTHFTPNFLLTNKFKIYGSRGRLFVHEWAHLRWGVFDEYNVDQPFYISSNKTIAPTRCSTQITGKTVVYKCQGGSCIKKPCQYDSHTGLYEANCTFIPEKSQFAKESIMFMQSLNSVTEFCKAKTHNTEAPNMQNRMCDHRSTWDVITKSNDFQNKSPMTGTNPPPHPTFSLLRVKIRVVCLVLDKSKSMLGEDRIFLMNQAVELYLIQIIETGSLVGMVTFDSSAEIQNYLTKMDGGNAYQNITAKLPQEPTGGTRICRGLKAGFQVITQSNQSTSGSEIILLTDGQDSNVTSCFEEVNQSGIIIHTIAVGPIADKELEILSSMTGGHRFFVNKDINGLIDAFSRISSRSGNITQQAIQLESKAFNVTGKGWMNGTVPVDSTIGNDTFFAVTWTMKKPDILLQDPNGKKYNTSDFKEGNINIRSARLRIPGIAKTGTWTYSLLNNHVKSEILTFIVTTRARSLTTIPVIATAHMSRNRADYPSPMIVYAQVSQGPLPILGINVTAVIETEDGHQVILELWDNGAGADTVKNDGIYSRYLNDYHGNGRYSLKVYAQARENKARLSLRQQNQAMYIPGYVENGKIILNPPRPEDKSDVEGAKVENFSRLTSGGSFIVSGVPLSGNPNQVFPPSKITDLKAKFKEDRIQLSWTSPGNVLDTGKAKLYITRMSKDLHALQNNLGNATLVDTSSLIPKEAGSTENFEFKPKPFKIENGTKIYIGIQAINKANRISKMSNIAQATKFIPPQKAIVIALGTKISTVNLAIWGLTVIISIF